MVHGVGPAREGEMRWERKVDHSINAVERLRCKKEYRPRLGEFEGFLDRICIFHP
jgi:hypothetical protein